MRIVVLAYHDIGYVCLRYLLDRGENVVGVVSHRDNPHETIWWRSGLELAHSHDIPTILPDEVNAQDTIEAIRNWRPDIIFSFFFRQMVCKEILDIPPRGCINLHGSLLPKYRGRVPINWAIIHGDTETGVTLHYMTEKPDAGDIIAQKPVAIEFSDTAKTLFDRMTIAAEELLRETYPLIKAGIAPRIAQDLSKGSYFGGRSPEDGLIDWTQPAVSIYNLVRAVTHPYPGAFTYLNGGKFYIWEAWPLKDAVLGRPGTIEHSPDHVGPLVATGAGSILILRGQLEVGKELEGKALLRECVLKAGSEFSVSPW